MRHFIPIIPTLALLPIVLFPVPTGAQEAPEKPSAEQSTKTDNSAGEPEKKLFTGKVVNVREALKERGIDAYEEVGDQVALETPDGELIPIVPDWRGRAFYQDERLRNRKVDLIGQRRDGVPYLQVLMVFTHDEEGQRQYTDYWCDICSIPMYEIKPCDCCQGPIRLRFQKRDLPDYVEGRGSRAEGQGPEQP